MPDRQAPINPAKISEGNPIRCHIHHFSIEEKNYV